MVNVLKFTASCMLLLFCSFALAQTADGYTPAVEDVCDDYEGAAWGLCNAYCEAMDCDSLAALATPKACEKVSAKFEKETGNPPPCDNVCPCSPLLSEGWSCNTPYGASGTFQCEPGNDPSYGSAGYFICLDSTDEYLRVDQVINYECTYTNKYYCSVGVDTTPASFQTEITQKQYDACLQLITPPN